MGLKWFGSDKMSGFEFVKNGLTPWLSMPYSNFKQHQTIEPYQTPDYPGRRKSLFFICKS
jgi:hypothetical protein